MSDEAVIKYLVPFHNKTVIYVPDCIKVPEYIIKESAILRAGRGKLMTIYNKHLDVIKNLMREKRLDPRELFLV